MPQQLRDFDSVASRWDHEPRRVQLAKAVSEAIIREAKPQSGMRVLDFGCGTGLVTLALAPLVRELVAGDSSQGMLDQLQAKLIDAEITNVRPLLSDHNGIMNLHDSFDLVVSSMTMHHIAEIPPLFRRFRAVMLPGAQLCIADLEAEDGFFHDDPTGIQHHGFAVAEMEAMFREAGFGAVHTLRVFSVPKQRDGKLREYPVNLTIGCVED